MSLFKVQVNGQSFIVDAETKALAKAYGKSQVSVEVGAVSAADLTGIDLAAVPVLKKKEKAEAEAPEGSAE
jgi:hypothetical protein